ncbi:PilW family protein [Collimonas sp.]|jgi:type IV pilus assembly protein PilW|uniref:PilW family protein n=1 Tax=Collimonas sp. TaxID=1963772 RepID=UPI002CF170CB|nr:PilW family protein [Collimonas sp.]HWW06702.1 PilW family protein [Collimonas sp.]
MSMKMQRGMSLIELMIAIAIGLVIMLAMTQVYMSGYGVQRAQTDTAQLNETARFSFDLLSRELKKSGYRNAWAVGSSTPAPLCAATSANLGSLSGLNDPTKVNPASSDFTGGTQVAVANLSDVLRVRFYGESFTKNGATIASSTAATAAMLDCQGYPVAQNQLVEDTLYVAKDPNNNNEPTLFCNTSNPTPVVGTTHPGPMALVSGVESMQLLYGEDTDADGIVNQYVPWNKVVNSDHILSVKVSIVARSPNAVGVASPTTAFQHFNAQYPASGNSDLGAVFTPPVPTDNRIRQMLSTEIAVRNFNSCP